MPHTLSFVTPFAHTTPRRRTPLACAESARAPVPATAATAAFQIQAAVRTALANGKRRLTVDMLMAAIDARSRTYDEHAASVIFDSMIAAMQPVLPAAPNADIRVVVAGATTALRVRTWLAASGRTDVSITVLGMEDPNSASPLADRPPDLLAGDLQATDGATVPPMLDDLDGVSALLVLSPPAKGVAIDDLRHLLRQAHEKNIPVVVHNHPREEAVYQLLGYGGVIPFEMWQYEPVFVLAPFAMRANAVKTTTQQKAQSQPRFVLMRQYPGEWALWRHNGLEELDLPEETGASAQYVLCGEFNRRPSDGRILHEVAKTVRKMGSI